MAMEFVFRPRRRVGRGCEAKATNAAVKAGGKDMRSKLSAVCVLAAVFWAGSAFAQTMIHESTERYYANGTQVITTPGMGGDNFIVGDIEGSPVWEVIEKGWWDEENDWTILSYTVGNDSFSDPITSLHVPKPIVPLHATAPVGWNVDILADEIVWSTDDESLGIPLFQTLDTMIVVYPGMLDIVYEPGVKVDFADQTILSNCNWVVSTVTPEPCSMLSVLAGLGLVGFKRRRQR